jgi:molybdenum cofactor synthesis domain-containing protein
VRIAILTVSDAGHHGARADTSGDLIASWSAEHGHSIVARAMVPDETVEIARQLLAWCDKDEADVVFTTGGTGLSPRDRTPEATRAVVDFESPGIAERMRVVEIDRFPRAALSRALAGVRGRTLIVNLPGSTSGVRDSLAAILPIVQHAVDIVRGARTDHSPGS